MLTWTTAAEFQNVGFHVYRADVSTESGRAVLSVGERLNLTLVPAKGDATSGAEYTFIDPLPLSSMDENRGYYLEDVDINFTQGLHGPAFLHGTSGNAGVANWRAIE